MDRDRLVKKVNYGLLAAFYAPLLTDRQQSMLQMYCDEDYSLSEIATQLSISRQAVSDNLNRAYERLDDLENQLQMYQRFIALKKQMTACTQLLRQVKPTKDTASFLQDALELLQHEDQPEGADDGI